VRLRGLGDCFASDNDVCGLAYVSYYEKGLCACKPMRKA